MTFDTVIHNGTLVTLNSDFEIIKNGILGINDGKIAKLAALDDGASPPAAKDAIDAGGGIIIPGLINTHTHLPMTLFRGLADDLPLDTWLNDIIFPAESKHVTPDTVRRASLLACAEMLMSGTTTCCDGYFFEDDVARAVNQSGLRAILGQGVIDYPAPGVPDPAENCDPNICFVSSYA